MLDPRFISAAAFIIIGLCIIFFVARVWMTHPINRVFKVGPYVTEEGLRLMLSHLPTIFSLGLFSLAAGLAKGAYALRWRGNYNGNWADLFGLIEAIFAVWAASCVIVAVVRLCRKG